MSKYKVLFKLTGSIAAYKACEVISKLVQGEVDVKVVCSKATTKFIGPATLEGLTGQKVYSDMYEAGEMMSHIHLDRWADLVMICPATARTINKLAHGVGEDYISTLFLAHDFKKPYLIAPAMNHHMYQHPAVQKSIKTLTDWGVEFIHPEDGALACGERGTGRLAEPTKILSRIYQHLWKPQVEAKSILISSGGTRETIDSVRHIANTSTGRTGATLADYFLARGYNVTFLTHPLAQKPLGPAKIRYFSDFSSLNWLMKEELKNPFAAIIHLAAVSDYSVSEVIQNGQVVPASPTTKIDSSEDIQLLLKKNFKILDRLRSYSTNPQIKIVGFKLTSSNDPRSQLTAVKKMFKSSDIDLAVHNDLTEMTTSKHPFRVYARDFFMLDSVNGAEALAELLEKYLFNNLSAKPVVPFGPEVTQ